MPRPRRNHESAERVTPLGLVREAVEYYCAAVAAERALRLGGSDIAISPVYFLIGHSIELGLKSFLRRSGFEPDALKDKFRHDLIKCLREAEAKVPSLGRVLSFDERTLLELLNENYRGKDFEYFGVGSVSYPYFEAIRQIARSILDHALQELAPPDFIRGELATVFYAVPSSSNA
jgi:hypothetical protein